MAIRNGECAVCGEAFTYEYVKGRPRARCETHLRRETGVLFSDERKGTCKACAVDFVYMFTKAPKLYCQDCVAGGDARRAWWVKVKSAPCMDCGQTFDACCMDFDHRPGEVKLMDIGKSSGGISMVRLLAEIAKCDLVCANCHRIRTRDRRPS